MIPPDKLLLMISEQENTIQKQAKVIEAMSAELAMILAGESENDESTL